MKHKDNGVLLSTILSTVIMVISGVLCATGIWSFGSGVIIDQIVLPICIFGLAGFCWIPYAHYCKVMKEMDEDK